MNFEGKNAVFELLNSSKTIEKIMIEDKTNDIKLREIFKQAKDNGIKVEFVMKKALDKISETGKHQGVIAIATDFVYADLSEVLKNNKDKQMLFVLLDGVLDPHNLGSVIRVAECVGATAVIIPKNRSVVVNETVIRVSAGACAHIPVCKVGNLVNTINLIKKQNIWVYACDMDGQNIYSTNFDGNVALVIGGEGQGVSNLVRKECDQIISLPLYGKVNSLNASVSAGIAMYEVIRQRNFKN